MADIVGVGRAVEKFLSLVESSVGTLYRPRAIRNEGKAKADAESYRLIAKAQATEQAKLVAFEGQQALAERTAARLRHQEMMKQENIEKIVQRTLPRIEGGGVSKDVDKDWLSYFFESCANVSNEEIQELWSKTLASKMTNPSNLPRKAIDCLRWLDPELAKQFISLSERIFLFGGFFSDEVTFNKRLLRSIEFPIEGDALEEIGLIRENVSKSFDFNCFSLSINCRELSDRSVEFRKFYEFTPSGKSLAYIVVPKIVKYLDFVRENTPEGWFDHDQYSAVRDHAESIVLSSTKKRKMAVSHIIHYLTDNEASVSLEKTIYVKSGRHTVHTPGEVLLLVATKDNKIVCHKNDKSDQWKAMGKFEIKFIEDIISYAEAHNASRAIAN